MKKKKERITVCTIACIYHILFIFLSVDGHLDCFHVLAVVNSAAVNITFNFVLITVDPPSVKISSGPVMTAHICESLSCVSIVLSALQDLSL